MKPFLLLLLAALIALGFLGRRVNASLREENVALRAERSAAEPLVAEIAALEQRLAAGSTPAPEFDRSELLRLRSTAQRLRSTQTDLEKIRAENERLAADLKSGNARPRRLADQPGFVARERWADVGNATPEAALQSVFYAMREANLDLLLPLISDVQSESIRHQLEENPAKVRADFARAMQAEFTPMGYVIVAREQIQDDKLMLKVKLGSQSEPMEMEFQRIGNFWKMSKGF